MCMYMFKASRSVTSETFVHPCNVCLQLFVFCFLVFPIARGCGTRRVLLGAAHSRAEWGSATSARCPQARSLPAIWSTAGRVGGVLQSEGSWRLSSSAAKLTLSTIYGIPYDAGWWPAYFEHFAIWGSPGLLRHRINKHLLSVAWCVFNSQVSQWALNCCFMFLQAMQGRCHLL